MNNLDQSITPTSSPFPWRTGLWQWLKEEAHRLMTDLTALWYASSDARVSLAAKLVATLVLALVLSPIDIIPDFIPVLGMLDDLILAPLGIWIAIKLIPENVWKEAKKRAEESSGKRLPANYCAAAVVVAFWLLTMLWVASITWTMWYKQPADAVTVPQIRE